MPVPFSSLSAQQLLNYMRVLFFIFGLTTILPSKAQFVDPDSLQLKQSQKQYIVYQNAIFARLPEDLNGISLRISNGVMEQSSDNISWQNTTETILPKGLEGDWISRPFLEGCVFVKNPTNITTQLDKKFLFDILAVRNQNIFEIGSKYTTIDNKDYPDISVYSRKENQEPILLSSFQILDCNFQFRLEQALFISDNLLAIFASSQDSGVNFVIFYDILSHKPIGSSTFSDCLFLPDENKISFTEPMPRSLYGKVAINKPKEFDLFLQNQLNPSLQDISLFKLK